MLEMFDIFNALMQNYCILSMKINQHLSSIYYLKNIIIKTRLINFEHLENFIEIMIDSIHVSYLFLFKQSEKFY